MKLCVNEVDELLKNRSAMSADDVSSVLETYTPLVVGLSKRFYILGGERDDLVQEGLMGLYEALKKWEPERNSSFEAFAALCVNRRMLSAIKLAGRKKHRPLNDCVSIDSCLGRASAESPEEIVLNREWYSRIRNVLLSSGLTGYESSVLGEHINGLKQSEIARKIGKDSKSVENALRRAKIKTREYLVNLNRTDE